jgi:hypothetical protein
MGTHQLETQQQRWRRINREAQDLVEDRGRPCDLCRRRMRYFPVRGRVVVRAPSRYLGWRCITCAFSSLYFSAMLSGKGVSPKEQRECMQSLAVDLVEQFGDLSSEQTTPLFEEARERLCRQMQAVGEAMATYEDSMELGNIIVFQKPLLPLSAVSIRADDSPSAPPSA